MPIMKYYIMCNHLPGNAEGGMRYIVPGRDGVGQPWNNFVNGNITTLFISYNDTVNNVYSVKCTVYIV